MKRLLFVDDEPMVLDGLQRMLRRYRDEWESNFATSGSEALAKLAQGSYDVIVTDMRMPGMDGAELLELVRDRYPGTIRIVLSGQCDTASAIRAAPVAHQFLAKPCDPNKLREVIERSCKCAEMVSNEGTRRVIAAIGELPPLPRNYADLLVALNNTETTLEQVGAIVERDVAVAAKVLQLVNSAFFGVSREIATVSVAVGFLGFEVLKQLVLTVELFRTFSSEWRAPGFSIEEIQRHSHSVAALASRLSNAPQQTAVLSIAALLHDVGKLVLAARLRKPFEQALKVSFEENRPLYLVEEELTGTSHAQIGAYLLGLWGLPPAVVGAVSDHHSLGPGSGGELDIGRLVYVANLLANEAVALAKSPSEQGSIIRARVDTELCDWKNQLADWRQTAAGIVQEAA